MEITKTQVKAGCYLRISSDPDDKREGVDRQREDTTALCEVKGWTPVDFYPDNDRSASNGKQRPQWDRMLADIKAGKIDAIAAWDQDRGWRMMHELEDLRRFFASLGRPVALATTGQGDIDLFSPTGVMMAQIKTAVSEHEIAMMKVRQRRAAKQKAESGRPQWKNAFGYLTETRKREDDDGTRTPDPKTAPLVKRAYGAILAGSSLGEVARLFNDAGAHGLNGKPWTESTVSLFLRAPRNAGLRSHNGEIVGKGTWPAIVDESVWRAAQTVLNAPGRAPGRKTVRQHKLTGVLRCGKPDCDGYLAGRWVMQKTGGQPGRPKAGERKEPHDGQRAHAITYSCRSCRGVAIRSEFAEDLLCGLAGGWLARPEAVDLLKSDVHDEDEAERIRTELSGLYGELDSIGMERGEGLLTGHQAKIASDIVNAKIARLERQQQDQERVRVFEGIRLGTREAAHDLRDLFDDAPDRFRAVVAAIMRPTVLPVGKGSKTPTPHRLVPNFIDC